MTAAPRSKLKVTVRYHEDPEGINYRDQNDNGPCPRRYYLDGVLDTERHAWLHRQMYSLAKLHHLTGEPDPGRRVAAPGGPARRPLKRCSCGPPRAMTSYHIWI